jgi:hypothetical protein
LSDAELDSVAGGKGFLENETTTTMIETTTSIMMTTTVEGVTNVYLTTSIAAVISTVVT